MAIWPTEPPDADACAEEPEAPCEHYGNSLADHLEDPAPAWALDPWSAAPRFLSVPADGRAAYLIQDPAPRYPWRFVPLSAFSQPLLVLPTYRREYQSPELGRVVVYSTPEDEERVLAALRIAEGAVLLLAWVGGRARGCPAAGADSHGAVPEVPAREAMAAVSPNGRGESST